ncbi:hypothetical protein [Aestuariimicrobium kwangyangense]|uniref:hypothetical protein n=1 Tax=Aestuariimicrobium kwangyangense TaxID=396389 RepID=UPI0003B4E76E|nr:hypothetical protein [Aestuariimicrobium kwangyangense]
MSVRSARSALAIVATIFIVIFSTVAPSAPGASALEQVTSTDAVGDFETTGTTVRGWSVSAPSPNSIVASGSRAISGLRSMRVQDTSTSLGAVATGPSFPVTRSVDVFVQGYAYITTGSQTLAILYYDASGAVVHRVTSNASTAGMAWSRISLRGVTPSTAATARIQVSSSSTMLSEGWWDAIAHLEPTTPNSGFEEQPTADQPVAQWTSSASSGASVTTATTGSRSGQQSALINDTSTTGKALLQSPLVPAFPAAGTQARFWMKLSQGRVTLTMRWYDANRALVGSEGFSLNLTPGSWQLVARTAIAPENAHYVSAQFWTSSTQTGVGALDAFTLKPASGTSVTTTRTESLGEPLDTFSNSQTSVMTTVGGRPKLYTVVSGYPAHFEVADVQTGRVEVDIPFDNENNSQSGAMTTGLDGNVYLGTQGGYLFRWRPGSTSLDPLGRATPTSSNVYDLETAPDGRIWGGTYPGGEVFSYTPGASGTVNHGQVAQGDSYARSLAVDGQYVYVAVGSVRPTIWRLNQSSPSTKVQIAPPVQLTSGNITELEVYGRFLATALPAGTTESGQSYSSQRYLYDLTKQTWDVPANVPGQSPAGMDSKKRFFYLAANYLNAVDQYGTYTPLARTDLNPGRNRQIYAGTLGGVKGEWLVSHDPARGVEAVNVATYQKVTYPLVFTPVSLRMKSLAPGANGSVYAGGYGGASLAVVNTATGAHETYPNDPGAKNVIGEVEGSINQGQYQFLGTYTRAKIFRQDTTQPWVDGSNPTLLVDLSSQGQDRPQGWAVSGQRTFFGTVPAYGRLGGVLGIIDTPTSTPRIVPAPVKDQSVVSLAASGNVVYGGTSRWGGMGSTPTTDTARLFAYDASTNRLLWSVAPAAGVQSYGAVLVAPDGKLWAAAGPVLYQLDRYSGRVLRRIMVNTLPQPVETTWKNVDLEYVNGLLYLAAIDRVYTIDPISLRVETPVPSGVTHRHLAVVGNDVYYPSGPELRRIVR